MMSHSLCRLLLVLTFMVLESTQTPLMIEEKDELLEKLKTKNMAVVFYGNMGTA